MSADDLIPIRGTTRRPWSGDSTDKGGSPGLINNGRVKAVGSVPIKKQLAGWLQQDEA